MQLFTLWMFFLALLMAVILGGLFWITGRYLSFWGLAGRVKHSRMLRFGLTLLFGVICLKSRMAALAVLHLFAIFALTELAVFLIRRMRRNRGSRRRRLFAGKIYRSGVVPLLLTGLFLGYGYNNMQHIAKTEYTVSSDKLSGDYKIVLITDTHYGTIQDPSVLKSAVEEISGQKPDVVILGGDIVEEGTSKEAMEEAFSVLGSIESRYGIYYVYGNHDRQLYTRVRAYTEDELANAIEQSGIEILNDRVIPVNEEIVLAGREDVAKASGRKPLEELLGEADRNQFLIVADHQPVDAEENAKLGVDLELAGHTHAGQIFPVGVINELTGFNYGAYQVGDCTVIVSSGATGWGFPVRTQKHCEYVVISLEKESDT